MSTIDKEISYYWYHIYQKKFTESQLLRNPKRAEEFSKIEDYIISNWGLVEKHPITNIISEWLDISGYNYFLHYKDHLDLIKDLSVFKTQYDESSNTQHLSHERKDDTEIVEYVPSIDEFANTYRRYIFIYNKMLNSDLPEYLKNSITDRTKNVINDIDKVLGKITPPLEKNPFVTKNIDNVENPFRFERDALNWKITWNGETQRVPNNTYTKWVAIILKNEQAPLSEFGEVAPLIRDIKSALSYTTDLGTRKGISQESPSNEDETEDVKQLSVLGGMAQVEKNTKKQRSKELGVTIESYNEQFDYGNTINENQSEDDDEINFGQTFIESDGEIMPEYKNAQQDLSDHLELMEGIKIQIRKQKDSGIETIESENILDGLKKEKERLEGQVKKGIAGLPKKDVDSITKGINREINSIAKSVSPELAFHLKQYIYIKEGRCVYIPDKPKSWKITF